MWSNPLIETCHGLSQANSKVHFVFLLLSAFFFLIALMLMLIVHCAHAVLYYIDGKSSKQATTWISLEPSSSSASSIAVNKQKWTTLDEVSTSMMNKTAKLFNHSNQNNGEHEEDERSEDEMSEEGNILLLDTRWLVQLASFNQVAASSMTSNMFVSGSDWATPSATPVHFKPSYNTDAPSTGTSSTDTPPTGTPLVDGGK